MESAGRLLVVPIPVYTAMSLRMTLQTITYLVRMETALLSESTKNPCDDFANYNHMLMPHAFVLITLEFSLVIMGIYTIIYG